MNIAEAIRVALQSLWANKLRSVLTLLGVVIGVGAVIAVVTFVSGIQGLRRQENFQSWRRRVHRLQDVRRSKTNVEHFLEAEKRKNLTWRTTRPCRKPAATATTWGAMAQRQRPGEATTSSPSATRRPGDHARDRSRFLTPI